MKFTQLRPTVDLILDLNHVPEEERDYWRDNFHVEADGGGFFLAPNDPVPDALAGVDSA